MASLSIFGLLHRNFIILMRLLLPTIFACCSFILCSVEKSNDRGNGETGTVDKFKNQRDKLAELFGQSKGHLPPIMLGRISDILCDFNSPKIKYSEDELNSDLNIIFYEKNNIESLTSLSRLFFSLLEYLSVVMWDISRKSPIGTVKISNNGEIEFLIRNIGWSEECLQFVNLTLLKLKLGSKTQLG